MSAFCGWRKYSSGSASTGENKQVRLYVVINQIPKPLAFNNVTDSVEISQNSNQIMLTTRENYLSHFRNYIFSWHRQCFDFTWQTLCFQLPVGEENGKSSSFTHQGIFKSPQYLPYSDPFKINNKNQLFIIDVKPWLHIPT